ncbi:kinase D-interacting substrate of 220 kDa-like [Mytilus galloprovincialis]|uniref:kinase D-interacting substrate of 220 kDa-like n=1 Tax=Mytilus galloprovincialis TaxID=29158 RepID=UPI003F7BE523
MPVHIEQIFNLKDRHIMGTLKTQMLWDSIRRGDLSASVTLLENGNINLEERDENGQTFLMLACELGEINIVRELLDADVDPNAVDSEKWCALLCAAKEGHLEVVIELLERGADIEHRDMSGWTSLMWACYKGKNLVVQELIERGANFNVKAEFGMSCLAWAAGRGHNEVGKYLIQKGAKVNASDKYGTTPLIWACRRGNLEMVESLLEAGASVDVVGMNSWTALLVATKGGFTEIVQSLLEHDPNVNALDKDGFTPLCIAAKEGFADIAHELLSKGAYVNIADKASDTILIHAVKGGHLELVRALINKYADVDVEGADGKTALYWAVEKGHTAIVYLLLDCDPDLEICTKDGDTVLLRAVRSRNEDVLRMLLDKKAKISVVDKKGDTALHIAIRGRSKKITELLLRNPRNSRLLYRPNKAGETPYQIDAYHQKGILSQIYGHRNLNAADGENLLGYDIYSSALADILSDPSLNTPITVGLYAKWGSGKSFLLGKLQKEMKSFTRASEDEHFTFCWPLFFFLLLINNVIGLTLALAVQWQIGLGVGLGLFALEYGFLAAIFVLVRKNNFRISNNISLVLGKELRSLTLLIKVLFCNPKLSSAKKVDVPTVKFLFSESTRLTSVGGEKALASMIGTLGDSLEQEYGTLVARLFRVFKKEADTINTYTGRFKTFCCVPYFVYLYIVLICLEAGVAMLVTFAKDDDVYFDPIHNVTTTDFGVKISSNIPVFVTLIVFSVIIGGAFFLNIFTWGQAVIAVVWSQKRRVMNAGSQLDRIKLDGLMHKLKLEVDIMAKMVTSMDGFTENQTRLVVVVDGLDSCEQDKVLQVLDTIKTLFSDEDSPFITILAVDPQIIIKGIESNIKTSFVDTNVNGFDYLRNVVHLPFYLQSQGMAIPKQTMTKGFSQYDVSETRPKSVQHQESTVSSTTVYEMRKKSRRKQGRSDSLSIAGTSNFDITGNFFSKNDYFSDVNPRSMRRLLNIVAVTGRLLRAYNIDFSWYRLASWINIIEQWPYRTSWIILYYEEKEMMDNNSTLFSIYQKIADKLPISKEVEPLLEIDRNPRKLEAFLSSKSSSSKSQMLTIADLKKFLPCTINLDPYLRKLIRELQKSTDVFRSEFPMFPPASGMSTSVLGVPSSMATGMIPDQYATPRRLSNIRNQSASNLLQTDRQMPPAMPQYGNMPYYPPHFYGIPSYMPQLSSNAKLLPEMTAKQATPDTFIKGYNNERLSLMSVQDICSLLSKLDGINNTFLLKYQDCVMDNNISGRVLVNCDLSELGQVLNMKFGDWQLFKAAVKSLIERENNLTARKMNPVREESEVNRNSQNSFGSGSTVGSNVSNGTNNKSEKSQKVFRSTNSEGSGSLKYKLPKNDIADDFETITEHEELVALNRRSKMPRNDSVIQQMSYESSLLHDAIHSFSQMDEEDEDEESDSDLEEIDADATPSGSLSSVLEIGSEVKKKKTLPVQFSLSSEQDNDVSLDSARISITGRDTEPLLGATAFPQVESDSSLYRESHHESLDEIRQMLSQDLGRQSSPNLSRTKLKSALTVVRNEDISKSTDSGGFTPGFTPGLGAGNRSPQFSAGSGLNNDEVELVNEVDHHHHKLTKENSIEDSIHDFVIDSAQNRSGQRSSPSSVDDIQMIILDHSKDKGPEAFV